MQTHKIQRFARRAKERGLPVDIETTGRFMDQTGKVLAVRESDLLVETRPRVGSSIPYERIEWIGLDLTALDSDAIL